MNKAKVEFELDDRGRAVFEGNDVIRGGTLFVSVGSRDVASPVIFDFFERWR